MKYHSIFIAISCPLLTILALAQPSRPKEVSFDNPGPISLVPDPASADASSVQIHFPVLLRNEGTRAAKICFSLQLQDAKGHFLTPYIAEEGSIKKDKAICPSQTIAAGGIQLYALQAELQNPAPPYSGLLIAETQADSKPKASTSVSVRLGTPVSDLPKPEISFTDSAVNVLVLTRNPRDEKSSVSFVTMLTNKGAAGATIHFSMQLQDDLGNLVKPSLEVVPAAEGNIENKGNGSCEQQQLIGPAETCPYQIRVDLEKPLRPLSGFLVVQVSQLTGPKASATKLIRIVQNMQPEVSCRVLWIPFSAALLSALAALIIIGPKHLSSRMGSPTWDFTKSWATNLSGLNALVGVFVAFTGIPDYGILMSRNAYVLLGLLFFALVTFAPLVFSFFSKPPDSGSSIQSAPNPETPTQNGKPPELQGYVASFILSLLMTLWGFLGQLTVIFFLLKDLSEAHLLTTSISYTFRVVIVFVGLFAMFYCIGSAYFTVKHQAAHRKRAIKAQQTNAAAEQRPKLVNPPLPKWSLL